MSIFRANFPRFFDDPFPRIHQRPVSPKSSSAYEDVMCLSMTILEYANVLSFVSIHQSLTKLAGGDYVNWLPLTSILLQMCTMCLFYAFYIRQYSFRSITCKKWGRHFCPSSLGLFTAINEDIFEGLS